jgi:hypothetical protein
MIVSSIFVFRRFRTTASGRVRRTCQSLAGSSTGTESSFLLDFGGHQRIMAGSGRAVLYFTCFKAILD